MKEFKRFLWIFFWIFYILFLIWLINLNVVGGVFIGIVVSAVLFPCMLFLRWLIREYKKR